MTVTTAPAATRAGRHDEDQPGRLVHRFIARRGVGGSGGEPEEEQEEGGVCKRGCERRNTNAPFSA